MNKERKPPDPLKGGEEAPQPPEGGEEEKKKGAGRRETEYGEKIHQKGIIHRKGERTKGKK